MRDNPLQFAVVREDPQVDAAVIRALGSRRILLVASGGCTGLALAALFPELEQQLLDPNLAQLDHVRAKMEALGRLEGPALRAAFNVETDAPGGLSERGNFESLFRGWRGLLHDLVLTRDRMQALFREPGALADAPRLLFENRYWPVAFELFFSDPMLHAMFGPDATQHAESGSYPGYFQQLFERGLAAAGARDNPFLHHVLLGHYIDRPECLPVFLQQPVPREWRIELVRGEVPDVDIGGFDLVGLSNIFDWMAPGRVSALIEQLRQELRPGATVMWRQLNNDRDVESVFGPAFEFDADLAARLLAADRSLFYSSLHIGTKT